MSMRSGEEGEVFPRRGEVPPVANDQAVAPRKQTFLRGMFQSNSLHIPPHYITTFLQRMYKCGNGRDEHMSHIARAEEYYAARRTITASTKKDVCIADIVIQQL